MKVPLEALHLFAPELNAGSGLVMVRLELGQLPGLHWIVTRREDRRG